MTGRQLNIQSLGAGYESFVATVVGRIAAMVDVRREHDYGVDFYVLPRVPLSTTTETAIELCALQVKGGAQDELSFGGVGKDGAWKAHELNWLRTLNVPLYAASVDKNYSEVSLYTLNPALGVFWRSGQPFEIRCRFSAPSPEQDHTFVAPEPSADPLGAGKGDGNRWTVELGPPFLHLRLQDLEASSFREMARDILLAWIQTDRVSLSYLHMGVPRQHILMGYRTNRVPNVVQHLMFWNPTPGASSTGIEQAVGAIATVLIQHLLGQKDGPSLSAWLPALEWLNARGTLDGFGIAALNEAKQAAG